MSVFVMLEPQSDPRRSVQAGLDAERRKLMYATLARAVCITSRAAHQLGLSLRTDALPATSKADGGVGQVILLFGRSGSGPPGGYSPHCLA